MLDSKCKIILKFLNNENKPCITSQQIYENIPSLSHDQIVKCLEYLNEIGYLKLSSVDGGFKIVRSLTHKGLNYQEFDI